MKRKTPFKLSGGWHSHPGNGGAFWRDLKIPGAIYPDLKSPENIYGKDFDINPVRAISYFTPKGVSSTRVGPGEYAKKIGSNTKYTVPRLVCIFKQFKVES